MRLHLRTRPRAQHLLALNDPPPPAALTPFPSACSFPLPPWRVQGVPAGAQEEVVHAYLSAAGGGLSVLRGMTGHLNCKVLDLEKIAQSLIGRLLERGLHTDALAAAEAMVVSLWDNRRRQQSAKQAVPVKSAPADWREALELLLRVPTDAAARKTVDRDECALVLACLHGLACAVVSAAEAAGRGAPFLDLLLQVRLPLSAFPAPLTSIDSSALTCCSSSTCHCLPAPPLTPAFCSAPAPPSDKWLLSLPQSYSLSARSP